MGYKSFVLDWGGDLNGKATWICQVASQVSSRISIWFSRFITILEYVWSEKSPDRYSHGANWWTLGDNWESTVLFFTMYFQFITSSFVFTFGSIFRKSIFHNKLLVVSFLTFRSCTYFDNRVIIIIPSSLDYTNDWF